VDDPVRRFHDSDRRPQPPLHTLPEIERAAFHRPFTPEAGGRDKKGNGDSFHSRQKRGQQRAMPSTYGAEVIVNTEDEWKPRSSSTI
jgi:hypothetical protein